jgi:DNA polymerase-1
MFSTDKVIFCWDSKFSKRKELYPDYKKKRSQRYKDWTPGEAKFEKGFRLQMKNLRRTYLKQIGYKNVFCQKGYEGDDIIASICEDLPRTSSAIIISSDQDMYQCFRPNVNIYGADRKQKTIQWFKQKYDITPKEWYMLKAITGCPTDEVQGVYGVGEKTGIKYLKGNLKETSVAYSDITSFAGIKIYKRNLKLVQLPFKGTRHFNLKQDKLSSKGWKEVMELLGMKSLRDKGPKNRVRDKGRLY